jgi:hypothetical protein
MTDHPPNPHAKTAVQHLLWALEEIEKVGNQEAARYARKALEALGKAAHR